MRCDKHEGMGFSYCNLCEVESLRAEIGRAKKALKQISMYGCIAPEDQRNTVDVARNALSAGEGRADSRSMKRVYELHDKVKEQIDDLGSPVEQGQEPVMGDQFPDDYEPDHDDPVQGGLND